MSTTLAESTPPLRNSPTGEFAAAHGYPSPVELPQASASGVERGAERAEFVKRKSGSCRFSPYFKLEWRDERIGAWRPLQKSFPTIEAARAARAHGKTWRTFEVSETGRRIIE